MISRTTIDSIYDRADITDVIGSFVTLKKHGHTYTACCPFHDEKTPSFNVNPVKGIYKCFGCGKGGNSAVSFLMDNQGMTYPDALRWLADKYNITVEAEEQTPEQQKVMDQREQFHEIYTWAAQRYAEALVKDGYKETEQVQYILSRFNPEQVDYWQIGYAPAGWDYLTNLARERKYKREFLVKSMLFREREQKGGGIYDFNRDRMMIPVHDTRGRVISFAGRDVSTEKSEHNIAKWQNGSETLIYNKDRVLFGLYQAAKSIKEKDRAIIVEGNGDVIHMHSIGATHTICSMGTSTTDSQFHLLSKYTKNITLLYDGDAAGRKALYRNGKKAVEMGMKVRCAIIPDEQDPEDFFYDSLSFNTWMSANEKDFILMVADEAMADIGNDPGKKREAIITISELVRHMDDMDQDIYIAQVVKESKGKVAKKNITDQVKAIIPVEVDHEQKALFPEGVDANAAERWGFFEHKNRYEFRNDKGTWVDMTNFIMRPIFHVISLTDSRRVYELLNERGYRVVVDLDMQEMTSLQAFKKNVEGRGNYLFKGSDQHMMKLKSWLYDNTPTCYEIPVLGWQKEGFFAWANGISTPEGIFQPVDDYGRVSFKDKNYYIPAFSLIYLEDKTMYSAERKFKYEERDVKLGDWMELFMKVYGDNGRLAFSFWCGAIFRDHIFKLFNNFPLLNFFGPKGTGKNQLAYSLGYLYGEFQTPYNLHNGTKAGFSEHMQQFSNALPILDEYKNSLDYEKIENLKSIHDGIGRMRMNMSRGMKKETTAVNSAAIMMGQEMPTADIALFSRVIFVQFKKTTFNSKEKKLFGELEKMQEKGLSQFTAMMIQHRSHFVKSFYREHEVALSELMAMEGTEIVEDRMARHYATLLASYRTLAKVQPEVDMGDGVMLKVIYENMMSQASQMSRSDELGIFWNIVEALFDDQKLIQDWHFKVQMMHAIKTNQGERQFDPTEVLCLKFNSVAKTYAEHVRRMGENALPVDTLKYYLENRPEFMGVAKAVKFTLKERDMATGEPLIKQQTTSAYCFDYKRLGINLHRDNEEGTGQVFPHKIDEPLPPQVKEPEMPF